MTSPAESLDAPPEAPPGPTRAWCLFRCGAEGYAVGLESVSEVVESGRLVRLPHSPPRVLGLCSLRREVIPVVDLSDPPRPTPAGPAGKLVLILKTPQGAWAVRVNDEGTVVVEEPDDPAGTAIHRGGTTYAVVDPEATWQGVRQSVEDWYRDRAGRGPEATPRQAQALTV